MEKYRAKLSEIAGIFFIRLHYMTLIGYHAVLAQP
jgi:hypothetical protein